MLLLVFLANAVGAAGLDNGLALTPPMGWRSWNAFHEDVSQSVMLQQVSAIAKRRTPSQPSLLELGYNHVGIDNGWEACGAGVNRTFHNASGYPIVNKTIFPDMAAMTAEAASKGVTMGWYANNCVCKEAVFSDIGGHPKQDAESMAAFGFGGIKIDGCGPAKNMTLWTKYLNSTAKPIFIEDCLNKAYWKGGQEPPVPTKVLLRDCPSNIYRTTRDVEPVFFSTMFNAIATQEFFIKYKSVTPASRPGCWAYPDMLEVGNLATLVESRTHFAVWSITSSPLILGFDLTDTSIYDAVYPIISDKLMLAVNQAWQGDSGSIAVNSTETFTAPYSRKKKKVATFPTWQIWKKPVNLDGRHQWAVLVINLQEKPQDVKLSFADIDYIFAHSAFVRVVDISKPSKPQVNDNGEIIFRDLASHDSKFLLIQPSAGSMATSV